MYVLVRKDLPGNQPAVQAGHALAEYLVEYPPDLEHEWYNGTLVYLGVDNEEQLVEWANKLRQNDIRYSVFREPYYENEATALAALCDCSEQKLRKMLNTLDLL